MINFVDSLGETDIVILFTPHDMKSAKESVQFEITVTDGAANQIEPLKVGMSTMAS
jgi:hypothetical protein